MGTATTIIDTKELVHRIQNGDKEAFSNLYDNYSKALYGVVCKIVKDDDVAKDILQDSFVKIWFNFKSYNGAKGTVFTWMLNVCRNSAIDYLRSQKRSGADFKIPIEAAERLSSGEPISGNDSMDIKRSVGKLRDDHQYIIELVYFEGYSQSQIVEKTNLPLGTVKSKVRAALIALREIYNH